MPGQLTLKQGYKKWRTLPNGIEIWRVEFNKQHRDYRAYRPRARQECADWGRYEGPGQHPPSGHVEGNFAMVQDRLAPCKTLQTWLKAVADLPEKAPRKPRVKARKPLRPPKPPRAS